MSPLTARHLKLRLRHMIVLPAALLVFSCGNRKAQADRPAARGIDSDYALNGQGYYSGHYSKGMLKLEINYISGDVASGFDMHKGLRRNLNGHVGEKDGKLLFELHEPGGNPTDGTFYLTLDSANWKITGKWVPTDASKAKGGPVELTKIDVAWRRRVNEQDTYWEGPLGELVFHSDGTCELHYYPGQDSTSSGEGQLTTIRGNYEMNNDTVRIEWQYNTHLPAMKMKLVQKAGTPGNDSTEEVGQSLVGNGVKFLQPEDEP